MPFDLLSDAHDEKELQTLRIQFKRMTTWPRKNRWF
jgi:hypothetical protein